MDEIVADAAIDFVSAKEAFDKFERENPNNSSNEWDRLFMAVDSTYQTLKEAVEDYDTIK